MFDTRLQSVVGRVQAEVGAQAFPWAALIDLLMTALTELLADCDAKVDRVTLVHRIRKPKPVHRVRLKVAVRRELAADGYDALRPYTETIVQAILTEAQGLDTAELSDIIAEALD